MAVPDCHYLYALDLRCSLGTIAPVKISQLSHNEQKQSNIMNSKISVGTLAQGTNDSPITKLGIKLIDKLTGLAKMQHLYELHQMSGLSKEAFADKLLHILNISLSGQQTLQEKMPTSGPVVIAANHPFGGIEGVILARLIGQIRPDLKVLANQGLQVFQELQDYFIFTNPLSERDPKNAASLKQSLRHVQNGGALLLFPAGRVSYYRKDLKRISDHQWNRLVASITVKTNAQYLPVHVEGYNSNTFYRLGRIYEKLRMMMLARELLNKTNQHVNLSCGTAIDGKLIKQSGNGDQQANLCRALTYAINNNWQQAWKQPETQNFAPLAPQAKGEILLNEVNALPQEQHLVSYKDFDVYYGFQAQMPTVVDEIARLRELVFRQHNEGSGEPLDTDHFDATYTQLFIINRKSGQIIGAYRMGQTDKLTEKIGREGLYLNQMFDFKPSFYNLSEPCLEMGRSFLVPEYQKSFYGLFLLWRGIGAFACKFPRFRRLYGTVSLSKLYDKRSIAIIEQALVKTRNDVSPRTAYNVELPADLQEFATQQSLRQNLSAFMQSIESDGKDIPILLKHYMKLGAEFYCLGVDRNFADTPGLLLCVDLLNIPDKMAKQYLAEGLEEYREYHR